MSSRSTFKYPFPVNSLFDKERMVKLIADNYLLNRTAVNLEMDVFVERLASELDARVIEARSGEDCMTWRIPQNWVVRKGQLRTLDGKVLADYDDHPLHLWSHSIPFTGKVSREELLEHHVLSDPRRPDEFIYHFRNGYRDTVREWGFSIPHSVVESMTDDEYFVEIDADLNEDNTVKVVDAFLPGELSDTIFIMGHTCHPGIVSDGIACIAVAAEMYHWLKGMKKRKYSYRFLFGPEYFGALAWLTQAPKEDVDNLKFGIYLDMISTHEPIGFQNSMQADSLMDRVTENVLKSHASYYERRDYRKLWGNDETFYNGPGFERPTIGIGRLMHREYHYNTDDLDHLSHYHLEESAWFVSRIINVFEKDFIPVRNYNGPLYLSRYDLYIDPTVDLEGYRNLEKMQVLANGENSCMDIADKMNADVYFVMDFFEKLLEKGLVERKERVPLASDSGKLF